MKKSLGRSIAKILGVAAAVVLVLVGGVFIYFKSQSTAEVSTKSGALHDLTIEEKLEDFNYMYQILEENHPYFEVEKRKTGYDWLDHREDFESWIKATKDNKDYYSTIGRILYLVQNGHTNIISPEMFDDNRRMYSGILNNAWKTVLNNEAVVGKYEKWKEIIQSKSSIIPLDFKYIEGNYIVTNPSFINEDILGSYNIPKYSILKAVDGIGIDPGIFALPNSGLIIRFPLEMGLNRFLKYNQM